MAYNSAAVAGIIAPQLSGVAGDRHGRVGGASLLFLVASVLLLTCSIAKESVWDVTKANIPFIGVLLFTLLLVTYVPVVTLGLVSVFYR